MHLIQKFCSLCAAPLRRAIPEDDDHPRDLCDTCGTVHYQNPKIIAGCIPIWDNRILLCKRAIEPRIGHWTLPAGFMELGESLEQAAQREAWEEAQTDVEIGALYTVFSLAHISQVHLFYRAEMKSSCFAAGRESLEVALFSPEAIPWDQLAFSSVRMTLEFLLADGEAPSHFPRSICL